MKLITGYSINKNFSAFQGLRSKHKTLQDLFNNMPAEYLIPQKSIEKISEIRPVMLAGTKCRNSIPLRKFWDFFEIDKKTFLKGFSTNKDGFANCFLKTKSCIPISTSDIHDCSVMYLFYNIKFYDKNSYARRFYQGSYHSGRFNFLQKTQT